MTTAVDLFAGPGGWDVAARELGIATVGLEIDPHACATRRAAGLRTVEGSVLDYAPRHFPADGLIASPPCQTFSTAGKGDGRRALEDVLAAIKQLEADSDHEVPLHVDDRTALVVEPLRWALAARDDGEPYRWLAFEQVPTVLPVWQATAGVLERAGYSVATGILGAEQYGVPQTRRRAVLVAQLDGEARLPAPTHSRFYPRDRARLDDGVLPWVSMATALGWDGDGYLRSNYGTGGDPAARGERGLDEPAPTVTSKIDRNKWVTCSAGRTAPITAGQVPRALDEPSVTITGKGTAAWVLTSGTRPRSAVRRFDEPAMAFAPGHDSASFTIAPADITVSDLPEAKRNGHARRVTIDEAAILQTFPADHPWQGNLGQRYQQIGNAVPPLLARAIVAEVAAIEEGRR